MFLSGCRKTVDTFVPPLGQLYRLSRDATNRRRSLQTPYGFTLAGDPSMASKGYETEEIRTFLDLLESHETVLDIGANVGLYSCLAASRGKHTVCFEPSPRNLNFLYRNLWENRYSDVEVFPLGLAGKSGLGRIYGFGGISSFVPGWAQAHEAHSTLVPVTTLDIAASGRFHGKKLLIKIDVEGFELDVLAGAAKTLNLNPKPTWLVEILLRDDVIPGGVSGKFAEVFEVFWKSGYLSRKLDAARALVGPEDVSRWMASGAVDGETHDFLFSAD